MTSFISELRRRNVHKVAAAYAVVSWILIEAGSVLLPTFGAPEWFFKGYVLLVIAGFILALVFAWVLEWTPDGVKLDKDVDRSAPPTDAGGRKLTYSIIGLLAVALTISVVFNVTGLRNGGVSGRDSSIAVLPFESRSTDPENALFADGIHDELLTGLANIQALKVISRTSVQKYRNPTRNLSEIAAELGVATVLEGSVQRAGDSVRINVQLIDALTDKHIWANIYDRKLTAKNIFQIQSEISAEITNALRTQLTPEEQGRMAAVPTENLQAYSLYMAGRSNVYKRRLETLREARQQFQEAIDLDPNYSYAYSGLADSILLLTINHQAIPQPEAHRLAKAALDKALALDEKNADAYASLGLLKMDMSGHDLSVKGFAEAEAAFRKAIELKPNHAEAYSWFASLKTAQQDWDEAIELYEKSLELDPLARISRSNLAGLYAQMGRNDEALSEWLEGVRINPDWPLAYENVARHLAGLGRLDEAYAWSMKSRELSTDPLAGQTLIGVLLQFGEAEQASEFLANVPKDHALFPLVDGFEKQLLGNNGAAIASWEAAIESGFENPKKYLVAPLADSALLTGDYAKSMKYVLQLNPDLSEPDFEVTAGNSQNALRYAYLLMREDPGSAHAAALLDQILGVVESAPRLGSAGHGIRDVQVLALQGKPAEAVARLQQAFDQGFRGSRLYDNWYLEQDPYLGAIRNTDRFRSVQRGIRAAVDIMQRRVQLARGRGEFEPILSSTRRSRT